MPRRTPPPCTACWCIFRHPPLSFQHRGLSWHHLRNEDMVPEGKTNLPTEIGKFLSQCTGQESRSLVRFKIWRSAQHLLCLSFCLFISSRTSKKGLDPGTVADTQWHTFNASTNLLVDYLLRFYYYSGIRALLCLSLWFGGM